MKEELITYNTAKLAKEKGFNQNPYKAVDNNCSAYCPKYKDATKSIIRLVNPLFSPENNIAIAPTQSLLQRWLREEHKIDVIPIPDTVKPSVYTCAIFNQFTTNNNIIENTVNVTILRRDDILTYYKYENALEQGLIEALKLIK